MKTAKIALIGLLCAVLLFAVLPAPSASADVTGTVGHYLEIKLYDTGTTKHYIAIYNVASIPNGMNVEKRSANTELWIVGTPTVAGTYKINGQVQEMDVDDDSQRWNNDFSVTVIIEEEVQPTPTPEPKVTITKHPTAETMTEGGSAIFIAKADNATEIVWLLISPDGLTTYRVSEAPNYFAGLRYQGLGTEVLTLLDIPYSLNGWKAAAEFHGPGGPVTSLGALITVEKKPEATPEPTPTPAPTAAPTQEPAPTAVPTAEPAAETPAPPVDTPAPVVETPAPAVATPAPAPVQQTVVPVVPIVIGAVLIVAMICGTAIYISTRSGGRKER